MINQEFQLAWEAYIADDEYEAWVDVNDEDLRNFSISTDPPSLSLNTHPQRNKNNVLLLSSSCHT
jgi:hypothetical protein